MGIKPREMNYNKITRILEDRMQLLTMKRQIVNDSIEWAVDTEDNDLYSWNFECNHITNPESKYRYKITADKHTNEVLFFTAHLVS